MANRLVDSTSPYLVQHADNPVDWWEWGPEALAVAQELDRPILLSVGYAACHWCHVMAHESFEDPATAAYMNDHFVNIKVDREERPDIDAVYMRATQAMTGQGGWPMTCILTPDGEPFFAGTYFPAEPRQGMPAFNQVLQALADAWENRRDDVRTVSADVINHLRQETDLGGDALDADALDAAAATLSTQHDDEAGGFGASPKFPPSMVLEFLLRQHARTGDARSLEMVATTCDAMARGGIYDQLAGGFARYGVDRFWRVPHFEKMLYDNAQLLRVYLHLWRQSGSSLAERVARETARFIVDELGTAEGGFASALDADSDGDEGTFYVWNPNQLMRLLGAQDGAWAAKLLGVTGEGTFERGFSTLQLLEDPDDPERWADVRARLLEARAERTRPERDDKVVAAWNGLAITALAEASVLLDDASLGEAAIASCHAARRRPWRRREGQRVRAIVPRRDGRSSRRRARGPRLRRRGVHRRARHHRRPGLARSRSRAPRRRARPLRPSLRWFLRHRGRRRGLGGAAAGRLRQRIPIGHVSRGRRPSWPLPRSAGSTATATPRRPHSHQPPRSRVRPPASPAGAWLLPRRCSRARPRSPSSVHAQSETSCTAPRCGSPRPAQSWSPQTPALRSPCSRAAPRSRGGPLRTSAGTSSAGCR